GFGEAPPDERFGLLAIATLSGDFAERPTARRDGLPLPHPAREVQALLDQLPRAKQVALAEGDDPEIVQHAPDDHVRVQLPRDDQAPLEPGASLFVVRLVDRNR